MITYVSVYIYITCYIYIEYNIQYMYIYTVLAKVISFWAGTFGVTELTGLRGLRRGRWTHGSLDGAVSWEAQTKMCPGRGEICHFCGVFEAFESPFES